MATCLSFCLSIYPSIYLSIHPFPFKAVKLNDCCFRASSHKWRMLHNSRYTNSSYRAARNPCPNCHLNFYESILHWLWNILWGNQNMISENLCQMKEIFIKLNIKFAESGLNFFFLFHYKNMPLCLTIHLVY